MNVQPYVRTTTEGFARPIQGKCELKRGDRVVVVGLTGKLKSGQYCYSDGTLYGGASQTKPRVFDIIPTEEGVVQEVTQNPYTKMIRVYAVFDCRTIRLQPKNLKKVS